MAFDPSSATLDKSTAPSPHEEAPAVGQFDPSTLPPVPPGAQGTGDEEGVQFDPSIWGGINRFVGGVATGELDPLAGVGLDFRDKLGLAQSETPAGAAGRVIGNIVNPTWEILRPIEGITAGVRYGGPLVRGALRTGEKAAQGAIAGAVMPGKHRGEQATAGGVIGALLGAPGAAARAAGFPNVSAAVQDVEREVPILRRAFNAARRLSVPSFNRAWYRYILDPIGGKVPDIASRESMADIEKQVGKTIDRATAGMRMDALPGTATKIRHEIERSLSQLSLSTSGGARDAYRSIIKQVYSDPLTYWGGKLDSTQFQNVTKTLADRIRAINPETQEGRALRRELENFRQTLFDTAQGGDKALWGKARAAWQKFAIARDASPASDPHGLFTPDTMSRELHQRYPLQAPEGRAPHQTPVQAAQQALLRPGRAAATAIRGPSPIAPRANLTPGIAAAGSQAVQPDTYESITP